MGQREISCNHEGSRGERDSGEKSWARLLHPKGSEVRAGAACGLVSSPGPGTSVLGMCDLGGSLSLGEDLRIKAVLGVNGGTSCLQIILLESA